MPRLTLLDLKQALPLTPPQPNTPILHLSQLRYLIITCNDPSQPRSFLSRVTFPPLNLLTIGCDTAEPGQDSYARIIQHIIQKVPASFANDFLSLTIDTTSIINNEGIKLTCHSYHDNDIGAGSPREVNFALGCTAELTAGTMIGVVVTLLHLNPTLQSLDLRAPITDYRILVRLFGSIPKLTTISVSGRPVIDIALLLYISISHPSAPPPYFPYLEAIHLNHVNTMNSLEVLEDLLIRRYEYGGEIKLLEFYRCPGLDSAKVKRFSDIVVDVIWDEGL